MKIVSLVPSWTETLLHWGVDVVGRTRFCIHPEGGLGAIPALGGTKNPDWAKINQLTPDVVVVDREENNRSVLTQTQIPLHITHVQRLADMPVEYQRFSALFADHGESEIAATVAREAEQWQSLLLEPKKIHELNLPAVVEWLRRPQQEVQKIIYLIWRDPWMAVSRDTFIGDTLTYLGFGEKLPNFNEKYPKIDLEAEMSEHTLLLFSSEPYPFAKKKADLLKIPCPAAIVDGEKFSWFGERSLRFLQNLS